MTDTKAYTRARGRAEAKYGFYTHAAVYAAVITLLIVINLLASPGTLWFVWPLVGWGLALALHGMGVFVLGGRTATIDQMTERELHRPRAGRRSGEI